MADPAPLSLPVPLETWLEGYVLSYLERDVRDLLSVGDLGRFQDFLGLAVGNSGQTVNFSRLGGDVGVTHPTAKSWLSVLEATFVVTRLRPWHRNLGKRLVKTPKLYFWDSGLLCHLLRIRNAEQLIPHPLRGAIFETWAVAELLKMFHHRGERPDAYFYRDRGGLEVDLLLRRSDHWLAIEDEVRVDDRERLQRAASPLHGADRGESRRPADPAGRGLRRRGCPPRVVRGDRPMASPP